ncbi:enoyl-CoA hydratase/isomerase family protein [Stutzerimonas azotifigens]|uniref:enoyl-CoA hydratase/isomerase family protein n=1 Tax=Stutzerimonas azotifigens TaxID=291995 RepID=UPI00041DCDCC|nr:enoyl-CoA hydratase/isomerase family protein [Stutzerimonas azotifigens]
MNQAGCSLVTVQREAEVAVLTLSRPEVYNAIDQALRDALRDRLAEMQQDESIKAVVLTGAGKAFSAGQDLNELASLDERGAREWIRSLGSLYESVRAFPKPLVVALNGLAAGGGFQIALHADIRIACADVRMAQTEVNVGLPSVLGPWIMNRVMGIGPTVDMSLTGRLVAADECLELGMVNRIVPRETLMIAAIDTARTLGSKSPLAIELSKKWMQQLAGKSFTQAIDMAADSVGEAFRSGDPQMRIAQFIEERRRRSADRAHLKP